MKKIVYKYILNFVRCAGKSQAPLTLPAGSDIIRIGTQGNNIYVWALVDPDQTEKQDLEIEMYGTGQIIEGHRRYLGTIEYFDGAEIYHYFIKPN